MEFQRFMENEKAVKAAEKLDAALSMLPEYKKEALEGLIAEVMHETAEWFYQEGKNSCSV